MALLKRFLTPALLMNIVTLAGIAATVLKDVNAPWAVVASAVVTAVFTAGSAVVKAAESNAGGALAVAHVDALSAAAKAPAAAAAMAAKVAPALGASLGDLQAVADVAAGKLAQAQADLVKAHAGQ